MKIISSKEYKKLKEYEKKYDLIVGQTFTLFTGGRSRRKAFLMLEKEELVRIIYDLNNQLCELIKEREKEIHGRKKRANNQFKSGKKKTVK